MKRFRVLLVDDEEELVFTLEERLALRGFDAMGVTDGAHALRILRKREFDVVVLDVKMPGMSGIEVLKRIKKDHPDVQIILLTGRGSLEESEEGMREGAFAYLVKPINIEALIIKMREAVSP